MYSRNGFFSNEAPSFSSFFSPGAQRFSVYGLHVAGKRAIFDNGRPIPTPIREKKSGKIRCLCDRRRARRLRGGDPGGAERTQNGPGGKGVPRRHLPQRRLHSDQNPHRRSGGAFRCAARRGIRRRNLRRDPSRLEENARPQERGDRQAPQRHRRAGKGGRRDDLLRTNFSTANSSSWRRGNMPAP